MSQQFTITAVARSDKGKGASRRLRREGMVPGVVYGGGKDPQMIAVPHNKLVQQLEHEAFYSSILTLEIEGNTERAVLKDLQRHPAKPFILHFDLQRVADTDRIRMHVPLHFVGEDKAPGVKAGGKIHHAMVDVEVICAAKDLPEHIEVDVSEMSVGDMIHLTDLKLPEGVEIAALTHGDESAHDEAVVTIQADRRAQAAAGESDNEEE